MAQALLTAEEAPVVDTSELDNEVPCLVNGNDLTHSMS